MSGRILRGAIPHIRTQQFDAGIDGRAKSTAQNVLDAEGIVSRMTMPMVGTCGTAIDRQGMIPAINRQERRSEPTHPGSSLQLVDAALRKRRRRLTDAVPTGATARQIRRGDRLAALLRFAIAAARLERLGRIDRARRFPGRTCRKRTAAQARPQKGRNDQPEGNARSPHTASIPGLPVK